MPADEVAVADAVDGGAEAVECGDETGVAGTEAGGAELDFGADVPLGGWVVGTVAGWFAVFQVATVGQAVVATVGDVVP